LRIFMRGMVGSLIFKRGRAAVIGGESRIRYFAE